MFPYIIGGAAICALFAIVTVAFNMHEMREQHQRFRSSEYRPRREETFPCACCMRKHPLRLRRFLSCGHVFCEDCLASYVLAELAMNSRKEIMCPMTNCNIKIKQDDCKSLVGEARQKYE